MRVYEIYNSIDGEVNGFTQGQFSTFIRFSGCNLKCIYCDTEYAQDKEEGKELSEKDIFYKVGNLGCMKVTITGGEPLLQPKEELFSLVRLLLDQGYDITIETNGSILIPYQYLLLDGLSWIVDYKLPSSGMWDSDREYQVLSTLKKDDWIKFVIANREDYEEALRVKESLQKGYYPSRFAFSPMFSSEKNIGINVNELVNWLKKDKQFDSVINLQLHKLVELQERN